MQQIITSFVECRDELQRLRKAASDRKIRRVIQIEIDRINRAISYLYHRKRR